MKNNSLSSCYALLLLSTHFEEKRDTTVKRLREVEKLYFNPSGISMVHICAFLSPVYIPVL
jgi:hypothetical protein